MYKECDSLTFRYKIAQDRLIDFNGMTTKIKNVVV